MGHLPEREVCHMRRHIDFDKIGITDDVMFCTVLSNSEDCREFLQRILGIEIEEIVIVGTQVSMKSNFHAKGVRLDVYAKDKKARKNKLLRLQQRISREINEGFLGKEMPCIVEALTQDGQVIARSYRDAPEIDGLVYIDTKKQLIPGDIELVKITNADEYDLYGTV